MKRRPWRLGELPTPVIAEFVGENEFLSNFHPAPTPHGGRVFPTSEHAFAAAKTTDPHTVERVLATADPSEAKQIGRTAPLRSGWDRVKFGVMEEIITAKFTHNPDLSARLLATRGSLIVEGNIWHDQTWGSCSCERHRTEPGDNALGVILMAVRMRLSGLGE